MREAVGRRRPPSGAGSSRRSEYPRLADFTTVFLSILLEAFPFVLLGTLISSAIHILVSAETIARILPRSRLAGLLAASAAGFAFPICECANVPVTRRLLAKGLPAPLAVTFLLAVAIVNPVVLFSTWVAFGGNLGVVLLRGLLGMGIAVLTGWIVGSLPVGRQPLRDTAPGGAGEEQGWEHGPDHGPGCDCGHDHPHDHDAGHGGNRGADTGRAGRRGAADAALEILTHAGAEIYSVGRYLILGAAVAALMQTILPRAALVGVGAAPLLSVAALMVLAYLLSLCSEADAFIAATFAGYFTPGAVLAFMVYGPMMDVKNTLMLLDGFKPRFVAILLALVTAACLGAGFLVNLLASGGVG
ncbi:MAG TPA: permease [Spirochaetia bacterium]|nr:permease [Spirochaetales bacterium]HRY79078.1 permease [Spirochaetia bacterium]